MEKHKCKVKPPSPSFSSSETEIKSSKNFTVRRRSKRIRKHEASWFNNHISSTHDQPMSSVSNTSQEEDVAFGLMMLSRDKWTDESEPESESDRKITNVKRTRNNGRIKYKCEICNKSFGSYQALGGHKASHKKTKVKQILKNQEITHVMMGDKLHKCPVCFKVFGSGQALGGHKRTHVMKVDKHKIKFIDLNLPAPSDDEDEVSMVSDGEFVKFH
ncbi:zinc finger protein ZAT9-like [Rutidosis leptorrhynchoides]|uniref:zinc finger protein ZAT9-like n=1 Tax=Rutidosis leptorrhynchoides TaxID=125765 RepID=UPI003A9A21A3